MVNTVLRKQSYVEKFWIRYLINHLRKDLEVKSNENTTKTLYRGTIFSNEEFQFIQNSLGKPFLLNGFISTSGDRNIAEKFMKYSQKEGFESVLLILEAGEQDMKKFASLKNISKFPHEDEYLINMNNFFRATNIKEAKNEKVKNTTKSQLNLHV
jgi:hypothetical protein